MVESYSKRKKVSSCLSRTINENKIYYTIKTWYWNNWTILNQRYVLAVILKATGYSELSWSSACLFLLSFRRWFDLRAWLAWRLSDSSSCSLDESSFSSCCSASSFLSSSWPFSISESFPFCSHGVSVDVCSVLVVSSSSSSSSTAVVDDSGSSTNDTVVTSMLLSTLN